MEWSPKTGQMSNTGIRCLCPILADTDNDSLVLHRRYTVLKQSLTTEGVCRYHFAWSKWNNFEQMKKDENYWVKPWMKISHNNLSMVPAQLLRGLSWLKESRRWPGETFQTLFNFNLCQWIYFLASPAHKGRSQHWRNLKNRISIMIPISEFWNIWM